MMIPRQTKRRIILSLLTASVLLAGCGGPVTVARLDGKLRVDIRGELFTEYHYKEFAKPILYPVIGPHGIGMTRNWPLKKGVAGEAADHPHHKSLWFTHGSVNGVDFWGEKSKSGRVVHDKILKIESPAARAVIQTANKWLKPGGEVVCTDTRTIAFAEVPGGRVIDYEITIHASNGAVTFGDTKEGTMGIRMNPALRLELGKRGNKVKGTGQAINSEGDRGKQLWGKRAKWVDYWAPIDGQTVGVAIFDHPKNPRHPTWWHARDYGLVAANPFGVHDFEKKPRGTGDMTIKAGESVTFRYRFFFHEGDALRAKIAERYLLWAQAGMGKEQVGGQAGTEIEKNKGQDEVLSTENLVKLAREAGSKHMNIPRNCKVSIRDEETKFVVTFIMELPPGTLGGDYYAEVTVDKRTSRVLQVLVAP